MPTSKNDDSINNFLSILKCSDVSEKSIKTIHNQVNKALKKNAKTPIEKILFEVMESMFKISPAFFDCTERGLYFSSRKKIPEIIFIIGPAGSGKTTFMAKIAAKMNLMTRLNVSLFSFNDFEIGGCANKIETIAGILDIPCGTFKGNPENFSGFLINSYSDYILIDTIGYSPNEKEGMFELKKIIECLNDIKVQKYLLLPANLKYIDMINIVENYEIFKPDKIVFTKLDETCNLGSVFSVIADTMIPCAFFTNGRRIPDDLMEANFKHLFDSIFDFTFGRIYKSNTDKGNENDIICNNLNLNKKYEELFENIKNYITNLKMDENSSEKEKFNVSKNTIFGSNLVIDKECYRDSQISLIKPYIDDNYIPYIKFMPEIEIELFKYLGNDKDGSFLRIDETNKLKLLEMIHQAVNKARKLFPDLNVVLVPDLIKKPLINLIMNYLLKNDVKILSNSDISKELIGHKPLFVSMIK